MLLRWNVELLILIGLICSFRRCIYYTYMYRPRIIPSPSFSLPHFFHSFSLLYFPSLFRNLLPSSFLFFLKRETEMHAASIRSHFCMFYSCVSLIFLRYSYLDCLASFYLFPLCTLCIWSFSDSSFCSVHYAVIWPSSTFYWFRSFHSNRRAFSLHASRYERASDSYIVNSRYIPSSFMLSFLSFLYRYLHLRSLLLLSLAPAYISR